MSRIPDEYYTLDFETYYDKEFTLRKLSNTAYIRDPRFKVHGVGIRKNTWKKPIWYTGKNTERALTDIAWGRYGLLCHHTHFDGLILSHHYGIVPAFYFDTLSMARPLHGGEIKNDLNSLAAHYGLGNKLPDILSSTKGVRDLNTTTLRALGRYCKVDVELTRELFLRMLPNFTDAELELIHHTISLFCDPICKVNKSLTKREHKKEVQRRECIVASVPYTETELRSRKRFPEILCEHWIDPPKKISPTTGKETWAFAKTDQEWIDLAQHEREDVRNLVEARNLVSSNINETRALRILEHGTPTLPIYLNYGKAHTLRWTGGDKMNPQNFPRDSLLRNAIIPPPGHKFVIVDSSQIEARVNAWLAGEKQLLDAFRDDLDIYSLFAGEQIYRRPIDKNKDKLERFVGKVCILGLGYQMGWKKFKHTLNIGAMGPPVFLGKDKEYENIVNAYRNTYRYIKMQWHTMERNLDYMQNAKRSQWKEYGPLQFETQKVLLPNDMYLRYPRLRVKKAEEEGQYDERVYNQNSKIYGGLLTENIIQALARIVVADQILEVAWKYKVVLMVHDEVILCVPNNQAKQALHDTIDAFKTPPVWAPDLPVAGEGGIARFYKKF